MAGIRNKIVVAQKIWGTESYIAYYDNGDAVMFTHLEDDPALGAFVKECTIEGCSKTVEFPVPAGAQSKVKCRQTIYCKSMTIGGATTLKDTAMGAVNAIAKGGINYVIWSPTFKRLIVQEGVIGSGRPISIPDLSKVPKATLDFMQQCINEHYALKRAYRTTVDNHMISAVDYLFSVKKLPKDFKGSDVDQIDDDELQAMGFAV